jgi:predicted TIM-barrel fold metal-dependent hydrolase
MKRRFFLQTVAAAPLAAGAGTTEPAALIDTNAWLGRWPFRHSPLEEPHAFADKLRTQGITEAWAGNLDALLHKDILAVNRRTADACKSISGGLLRPVGALNPRLPGWRGTLHECAHTHGMKIIRLHPNYHGYTLAEPLAVEVLRECVTAGMCVQIPLVMEDERTLHPLVQVPPVDPAPLADHLTQIPGLRVQLLNAFRTLRGLPIKTLAARGFSFEIATLEGIEGVANLLKEIPADKVCFGSHAPVFILESAKLKLTESRLSPAERAAISAQNARALLT